EHAGDERHRPARGAVGPRQQRDVRVRHIRVDTGHVRPRHVERREVPGHQALHAAVAGVGGRRGAVVMSTCPLPVRATVRDVLADLLGREVTIDQAAPQTLDDERAAYAATYVWDDGRVAAVGIWELSLAAGAGSAIGMVAAEQAVDAVEAGALSEEQREFFHEVVNVLAKVLNSPETPHVK